MFPVTYCHQGLPLLEEVLAGLNIRQKEFSTLKQKSGIDPHAVSGLLKEIKHHQGIYRHCLNVARLSAQLAHRLNLTAVEVYIISIGALLHDIGKMRLPYDILDKQGKLNKDEWSLVKKHPQLGVSIVSKYDWAQQLEPMLLLHHERLDGEGYFAVSPEKIPLSARIITLTDAFDAMVSPRPYQEQRDLRDCWEEIERCSGTQFDPDLLPGFYSVITRR
ncbi:MAG: HD-GYP domain-containing protein [Desulfocucumaceae bacterium]